MPNDTFVPAPNRPQEALPPERPGGAAARVVIPADTQAASKAAGPASKAARAAPEAPRTERDSHLTLHYRVSLADTGAVVIDTFEGKPATLQLGIGQMAEPLERKLQGLAEGAEQRFDLAPEEAFGPRNPALVQRVSRDMLAANSAPGEVYAPGDLVEFAAPDGGRFAGVLKSLDDGGALFDFNHPLAGQRIRFEVRVLGVL